MNDGTVKIGIEFEVDDKELRQVGSKVENSVNTPKKTIEQFAKDTNQTVEQVKQKIAELAAEYQAAGMTVQNAFRRAYDEMGVMSDRAAKKQRRALQDVADAATGAADGMQDVANAAGQIDVQSAGTSEPLHDLADAIDDLKDSSSGGIPELSDISDAAEELGEEARKAADPIREIADSISRLDEEINGIDRELSEVNKLLAKNGDNAELIAQKNSLLQKAYDLTADKLNLLRNAQNRVNDAYKKNEIPDKEYREFNRALISTESALENYEKELLGTNIAIDNVEENTERATRETRQFGAAANAAERSADKFAAALLKVSAVAGTSITKSVGLATSVMQGFATVAGGSLVAAGTGAAASLTALGGGLTALIGYGANYNAEIEQLQTSFEVMTGSAEKAAEIIERLREMGSETPFETKDLAETTQLLMNYGVSADRVIDVMSMLGDVSQGNAEKMKGIAMAYGQMSSAGKVYLEDVKQMIERGFNPLQEISETTGESMDSLYERISDGELSVDEITASMVRSTSAGGKYFESMIKQSQTMAGQISTLKDNFAMLAGTIAGDTTNAITQSFLPSLSQAISAMDSAFRADGFQGLSKEFGLFLGDATTEGIRQLPAFMDLGTELMQGVYSGFVQNSGDVKRGFDDLLKELPDFVADNIGLMYNVGGLLVSSLSSSVARNSDEIADGVERVIRSMVGFFQQHTPEVAYAATELIDAFADEFKADSGRLYESIKDVLAEIPDFLNDNLDALLSGGVGFVKIISDLITGSIRAISGIAGTHEKEIENAVQEVLDIIFDGFEGGTGDAGRLAEQMIGLIAKTLTNNSDRVADGAVSLLHAFVGFIARNAPLLIDSGITLVKSLAESMDNAETERMLINAAVWLVVYLARLITNNIGWITTAGVDIVETLVEEITSTENLSKLLNAGAAILAAVISAVGGNIDDVADTAITLVDSLANGISSGDALKELEGPCKQVVDAIMGDLLTQENVEKVTAAAAKILGFLTFGLVNAVTSEESLAEIGRFSADLLGTIATSLLTLDWGAVGIGIVESIISGITGKEFELPDWAKGLLNASGTGVGGMIVKPGVSGSAASGAAGGGAYRPSVPSLDAAFVGASVRSANAAFNAAMIPAAVSNSSVSTTNSRQVNMVVNMTNNVRNDSDITKISEELWGLKNANTYGTGGAF